MTIEERLDRLTGIVDSLAGSVVAHDDMIEDHDRRIEALITIAEKHQIELDKTDKLIKDLSKQWQAYINTLPRT